MFVARVHWTDLDLTELDPFGEWQNPQEFPEIMRELRVLQLEGVSFSDSVGYVRSLRPVPPVFVEGADRVVWKKACDAIPREAQLFWESPLSKAHLLNALFRRGSRTVTETEIDPNNGMCIPSGKIYAYLKNKGIDFQARPRVGVNVRAVDGDVYRARILEEDPQDPRKALLQIDRVPIPQWGHWSASDWAYRLSKPVALSGYAKTSAAGRLMGLPPHLAARVASRSGVSFGDRNRVPLALLTAFVPES